MDIFFDESGQTGTHLFDAEQPFFALASTNVPESQADEILGRCFPRNQGPELKSSKVLRRGQGRRVYLDFAREIGRMPERFASVKINKRYAVVSKMVDNLVEPLLRSQGYDFYAGDYAYRFANTAFFAFEHAIDRSVAEGLMRMYNDFARAPSATAIHQLAVALDSLRRGGPDLRDLVFSLLADGARRVDDLGSFDVVEDSNDVHVTSVVQCMAHWQALSDGPFRVVHDESVHFFKRSERWRSMTDPAIEPEIIQVGAKTLSLPIPVLETVSASSERCASLQLCDLVAGFASRYSSARSSDEDREFYRQAIDAGLGRLKVFPIDAGHELVQGPPERAVGPDVVDRIARAIGGPSAS